MAYHDEDYCDELELLLAMTEEEHREMFKADPIQEELSHWSKELLEARTELATMLRMQKNSQLPEGAYDEAIESVEDLIELYENKIEGVLHGIR